MTIRIFKADTSPAVRCVLMIAEYLNLTYEQVEVDTMAGEQLTPEYRERNPQHSVPYLEDGHFQLADSHAISTYLISKYGGDKQAKLYPQELQVRATIDQRLFFDTSLLFPSIKYIFRTITGGERTTPTEEQIKDVIDGYDILEKYLQKTKFVAADHLTVADVSIVSTISSLNTLVPIDQKYVKIHAWWNLLKEEDWYKKGNLKGLTIMEEFVKNMVK